MRSHSHPVPQGQPYGARHQKRVNAWIEVESWYGWSGGSYWSGEDT